MSLYGLDLIIDKKGNLHLIEINGIASGMNGFKQVYGDDRVKERVYGMLKKAYGKLTWDDGTYAQEIHKKVNWNERRALMKKHPFIYALVASAHKIPYFRRRFHPEWESEKSSLGWINESAPNSQTLEFPFEVYTGQESAVLNATSNSHFIETPVNPYVAEELAGNKFLQYWVMKDTKVEQFMTRSALVGLGWAWREELTDLMEQHSQFVLKPVLGKTGRGVELINQDRVREFLESKGPITDESALIDIMHYLPKELKNPYLEDLIDRGSFGFEHAVSVIQPWIDSRMEIEGEEKYTSIRVIICNGEFVDAYMRYSDNPIVNLSQDAEARHFEMEELEQICVDIVDEFEMKGINRKLEGEQYVKELHRITPEPNLFKRILYGDYLDAAGRTSDEERMYNRMMNSHIFQAFAMALRTG